MTKIFKSTWFKCISILLALAVVLGGTLAILNDVLYVSPEERTGRAIKKIYGEEVEYNDDENPEEPIVYEEFGSINKIYSVGEDMLFQVTGKNGYKGGTITLWIKVVSDNGSKVIEKIILEGYEKQTLMSKFDSGYYQAFYKDVSSVGKDGFFNPNAGATKSANAMNNAVKCVSEYFKGVSE